MSNGTKLFLILALLFMVVTTATVVAAGRAVVDDGAVVVRVRSEGATDFALRVPATAVRVAAGLVPRRVLEEAHRELDAEVGAAFDGVRGSLAALDDAPDFEVVRARVDGADVLVRKTGRRIEIDVAGRATDDTVHVSVPISVLRTLVGVAEKGAGG